MLVACRTAPNQSWRNPVERIMSIINLGLQCVGIMRNKLSDEVEDIKNCNNLRQLRAALASDPSKVDETLAPQIELLNDNMKRLQLKGQPFKVYDAATSSEITAFWEILLQIDASLTENDTTKRDIKDKCNLQTFLQHCCVFRHYSFQIKKCGHPNCDICKPVKMPAEQFATLHFLPDPTPGDDGHYLPFEKMYWETTTEEHRPSLTRKTR